MGKPTYNQENQHIKKLPGLETDFDDTVYEQLYQGTKKILMVCTEERNMTMANEKKFSTGSIQLRCYCT